MRNVFACILLVLVSCSGKKNLPTGIIEPKKMQQVMWDYIRADVYSNDFLKKDSSKKMNDTLENIRLQNKVFGFYRITREEFYNSYNYYIDHPEMMDPLMDSMISKQNRIKLQQQLNHAKKHGLPKQLPKDVKQTEYE